MIKCHHAFLATAHGRVNSANEESAPPIRVGGRQNVRDKFASLTVARFGAIYQTRGGIMIKKTVTKAI